MSSRETVSGWLGRSVLVGCEKLCHTMWSVPLWRMKLPASDMVADCTPELEVLEVHTVVVPSERTRFPVASSLRIAFWLTREFLYGEDCNRENENGRLKIHYINLQKLL